MKCQQRVQVCTELRSLAPLTHSACVQEANVVLNQERQRSGLLSLLFANPWFIKFWDRNPAGFVGRRTGKNTRSPPELQSASVCKQATGKLPFNVKFQLNGQTRVCFGLVQPGFALVLWPCLVPCCSVDESWKMQLREKPVWKCFEQWGRKRGWWEGIYPSQTALIESGGKKNINL